MDIKPGTIESGGRTITYEQVAAGTVMAAEDGIPFAVADYDGNWKTGGDVERAVLARADRVSGRR